LEREVSREPLESLEDLDWKEEKVARESLGYQGGQESKGGQELRVLLTQTWQSLENLDPSALKEMMDSLANLVFREGRDNLASEA